MKDNEKKVEHTAKHVTHECGEAEKQIAQKIKNTSKHIESAVPKHKTGNIKNATKYTISSDSRKLFIGVDSTNCCPASFQFTGDRFVFGKELTFPLLFHFYNI